MRGYCTLEIHPPKSVDILNRKHEFFFFEIAETIPVMLLICGFEVDFSFFTTNPQMFAVRDRFANPQTKSLSRNLRTCGPVCGRAQHCLYETKTLSLSVCAVV